MTFERACGKVVSLFSGCGGLDLGFVQAGFDIVYASDHDQQAVEVYRRNLDRRAVVRDVLDKGFHDEISTLSQTDVVLGGFPCQGFSKAGPKKQNDARNSLYREMHAVVETLHPRVFIAENVDGMSQNYGGAFVKAISADFSQIGYEVECRILDAAAFGVAQHRRRVFFVGIQRQGPVFPWPKETHTAPLRNGEFRVSAPSLDLWSGNTSTSISTPPPRTIREAIGDMPSLGLMLDHRINHAWPGKYKHIFDAIGPGQKLCNVRHSKSSVYTWQIPQVFGEVTQFQRCILETIATHRRHKMYGNIPNGNPLPPEEIARLMHHNGELDEDIAKLEKTRYLKRVGSGYDLRGAMFCSGLFKRPLWDEPAPTVLTNFHNPRYFLHPEENRPFSLRECARLQGFPDDFLFCSENSTSDLIAGYRLVGNAVPPPLARALADSVQAYLQTEARERRAA